MYFVVLSASVAHVLWECPAYGNCRLTFLEKLQELLGDKYVDFDSLNYLEKTSYVLGSELWEDDFSSLLSIVKEFIVDVWESRKFNVLAPSLTPRGGILVRMISCGMVGMAGVVS